MARSTSLPKPSDFKRKLHEINQLLLPINREWNDVLEDSYTSEHGNSFASDGGGSRSITVTDPTGDTAINRYKDAKRSVCKSAWHDVQLAHQLLDNALASLRETWPDSMDQYDRVCVHCTDTSVVPLRRGLCGECYPYWHRTGNLPTENVLAKRDARS